MGKSLHKGFTISSLGLTGNRRPFSSTTMPGWLRLLFAAFLAHTVFLAKAQDFQWATRVGGATPGPWIELGTNDAIDVDKKGNVYIAKAFNGTEDFDPGPGVAQLSPIMGCKAAKVLAKYDANGKYLWAKLIMSESTDAEPYSPSAIAVDDMGRVTVVARVFNSSNATTASYFMNAKGQVDSIVKQFMESESIFIVRFDSSGNFSWIKTINSEILNGSASLLALEADVDRQGGLYIAGLFDGRVDLDPDTGRAQITSTSVNGNESQGFIAKYSVEGAYQWGGCIGGDSSTAQIFSIVVDTTGNRNDCYVTGWHRGITDFDCGMGVANLRVDNANGIFIAKYNKDGHYVWARSMDCSGVFNSNDIAIDRQGDIYITGNFAGNVDFDPGAGTGILASTGVADIFLAKYSGDGNYQWARNMGGACLGATGTLLELSDMNEIYVGGSFILGEVDFDPADSCTSILTTPFADVFLARYTPAGHYVWSGQVGRTGGMSNPDGLCIAAKQGGGCDVYLSGQFTPDADFDPSPNNDFTLTAEKEADGFLMKMSVTDTPASTAYLTIPVCDEFSYTLNGITYTESGRYVQSLPGILHCDSTIVLDIIFGEVEKPVITISEFVLGVNQSYAQYQWIKNDTLIPGATDSTYTVTENGDYQVKVTNEMGCAGISAKYRVSNVGIHGAATGGTISVYPNPARDKVHIASPVAIAIELLTADGRRVMQEKRGGVVSMSHLANGIYILKIRDESGNLLKTEKLIKAQ